LDLPEIEWGVEWIDLAPDRNKWQALVNVVMIQCWLGTVLCRWLAGWLVGWLVGVHRTHTISCKPWKRSVSAVNTIHVEKNKKINLTIKKYELVNRIKMILPSYCKRVLRLKTHTHTHTKYPG